MARAQRRRARTADSARDVRAAPEAPGDEPRRKSALRENFESVAVAVLFAVFVRAFVAQPYKIPSSSMEQSLLVGDHLVVDKVLYGGAPAEDGPAILPTCDVERGDVVIFRPPDDPQTDYIKRVIGLPNETLRLVLDPRRNGVRVFVDGEPLPENYQRGEDGKVVREPGARWTVYYFGPAAETVAHAPTERTVTLGPAQYLMLGDNRNMSHDSRFWSRPAVDAERIRGKALFVYWSYEGRELEDGTFGERLAHYARIGWTFFSRSRWDRTFERIR